MGESHHIAVPMEELDQTAMSHLQQHRHQLDHHHHHQVATTNTFHLVSTADKVQNVSYQ